MFGIIPEWLLGAAATFALTEFYRCRDKRERAIDSCRAAWTGFFAAHRCWVLAVHHLTVCMARADLHELAPARERSAQAYDALTRAVESLRFVKGTDRWIDAACELVRGPDADETIDGYVSTAQNEADELSRMILDELDSAFDERYADDDDRIRSMPVSIARRLRSKPKETAD